VNKTTILRTASLAGLLLASCAALAAPRDADARFRAIYTAEWQWRQSEMPGDEDSLQPVRPNLPHVDAASQEARLRHWLDVRRQLQDIRRASLSPKEQLNYDVYKPQIDVLIANQQLRAYEMPVNADTMFWTDLGYTARRTYRNVRDYDNWIGQLRDMPRYFREQMQQMRAGLARGFTPPQVTLQGREASLTAVTDAAPEDCLLYTPFKEMQGIAEADRVRLRAAALAAIRDQAQPAYREMLEFMRGTYVPQARRSLGASELPGGREFYRAKIREFTTLDEDPGKIHAFGEAEVARLHAQMLEVMRETGFSGEFPQFLKFLRTDPRFAPKSAEELLMRAAWIAKSFDAKARQYFGYMPRARFAIVPVPPDLAPFYTAGRGGPEQYLLNTYDLPSRPLYNLAALTLHESAPGHTWQGSIALEHKDQPEFRQSTYISAYGEGWALYCEYLGIEMGMYPTPYDRFGMLGYQIWRAARLVVDTGVHAQGWTRERAIDYLRTYTALSDHEIETEVDRYISWPAQALSYYLGETAMLRNRSRAQSALGDRFNIRAFHDTVLELGSVPLPVLDARIDKFIADGGRGPYPEFE
jgi:uncharacterized protein (DUF885 family)